MSAIAACLLNDAGMSRHCEERGMPTMAAFYAGLALALAVEIIGAGC